VAFNRDHALRSALELRPNATAAAALLRFGAVPGTAARAPVAPGLDLSDDPAVELWWHDLHSGAAVEPLTLTRLPHLASRHLLCCGGPTLDRLLLAPQSDAPSGAPRLFDLRAALPYMSVLARATPGAKERVIAALQARPPPNSPGSRSSSGGSRGNAEVLFCGDGGNDLGGLHAASTGVAVVALSAAATAAAARSQAAPGAPGDQAGAGRRSSSSSGGAGGGGAGVEGSSLAAVAPFAADGAKRCVLGVAAVVGVGRCAQASLVAGHAAHAVDAMLSAAVGAKGRPRPGGSGVG